jgi:polysaccharide biosynthesis protein PslJ
MYRATLTRARGLPLSALALIAGLALVAADVVFAGSGHVELAAACVLAVVVGLGVAWVVRSWPRMVCGLLLVVLLIPSDGRYTLPGGLPFQLEPYRVIAGLVLAWWICALLIDRSVRARATRFEAPLILIIVATLGSDLANPARVSHTSSNVIKALWLFVCFVLFVYMAVSVVRTRAFLERILSLIVTAGAVVGAAAAVQHEDGFNLFNHLHPLIPIFSYTPSAALAQLLRGGDVRATASAGHPIELSTVMAMLLPIAIYLAISRRQVRWLVAGLALLLGDFAGGSRTGIIGLVVIVAVFLWMRPRETRRAWPALLPLMVVLHVLAPGALGSIEEGFFPSGGIVSEQSQTYVSDGVTVQATRLSRIGPQLHLFNEHNDPLLGEGFGTRIFGIGQQDNAQILDDQWLGTLIETGVLGVLGWAWLFTTVIRRLRARAKLEDQLPEGWLPVALAASVGVFAASMFTYDAFGFTQGTFMAFTIVALSSILLWLPSAVETPAASGNGGQPAPPPPPRRPRLLELAPRVGAQV